MTAALFAHMLRTLPGLPGLAAIGAVIAICAGLSRKFGHRGRHRLTQGRGDG
jgi:hypothetical protein